jgi:hypothetical protein
MCMCMALLIRVHVLDSVHVHVHVLYGSFRAKTCKDGLLLWQLI